MPISGSMRHYYLPKTSTQWRKVSENVFIKGQANDTLSSYLQIGDTTCMNYYNRIVVNVLSEIQQHIQASTQITN